jgi:hypothetical protein
VRAASLRPGVAERAQNLERQAPAVALRLQRWRVDQLKKEISAHDLERNGHADKAGKKLGFVIV